MRNILKSVMGLYLCMTIIWIMGIAKDRYWETATICNFLFMSGLAIGKLISMLTDGTPSFIFIIGLIGEAVLAAFAFFNWKEICETNITVSVGEEIYR